MRFEATINGDAVSWEIEPHEFLTEVLRRNGLIGTKRGCESGACGACTVLIGGREINSCTLLAAQAGGHEITTIEALGSADALHPVQQAFVETGAVQCGFCTPGMVLATYAMLQENPRPTEADARACLAGHLCRCTGYIKPIESILLAAERMSGGAATREEG